MTHKRSVSHDDVMIKQLRNDPVFAVEYLRAALEEEDDPQVLLIALRHVVEARGGIAKIAEQAGVKQEILRRSLAGRESPRLRLLLPVAKALGLKLSVEPA
jgi:probable addiction module antidote protein